MQTVSNNTLKQTLYYRDITVLIYNIQYPAFNSTCSEKAAEAVSENYAALARSKEEYCKAVLYPQAVESARYIQSNYPPFHSYEFDMTYNITLNMGCLTSLYTEQYSYMGGAHGSTVRQSDTWDFTTGNKVQLGDFYPHDRLFREKIQRWIEQQVSIRLKTEPATYFDDYAKLVQNTFNPDSFYLSPGGVVIYFQQYDIAPYATGLPEFVLPVPPGFEPLFTRK